MSLHVRRRVRTAAIGAAAVALLAAGCGSEGGGGGSSTPNDTLVVYTGQATDYTANFNPFSPTLIEGPGTIYEPLFYYNASSQGDPEPKLGTEYEWTKDDGTELTITLREGVTWSDGKPFTAEDVKFTFDLVKSEAVPNTIGFTGETEVVDDTTVKVTFEEPSYMDGPQLLGKTYIVPKHIWSEIADPAADPIEQPVGTGPFTLTDFKPQAFVLTANAEYWDGEPAVKNIRYRSLSGNQAAASSLEAGEIDVQTGPVPNLENVEAAYDGYKSVIVPMNQTVLDACANADLGCEGPQTDPAVRQAIYYAMDREQLNSLAFQNTSSDISPGFALPERDAAYLSADLENRTAPANADAARAEEILTDAGWERGDDGIFAKDGQKLSITATVVSGWTDYITALDTMSEQLKQVGIELIPSQVSWNEMSDSRATGNYQLLIDSLYPGPAADPYYVYSYFYGSGNTAEVGEIGSTNYSRYVNEDVDTAIDELSQLDPADSEARQPYYDEIQAQIEQDMPYIPILTAGTITVFNAEKFSGWPTNVDLYAFPAVWSRPDQAEVFANLKPNGE
ncbi:ABC transporter substrate-binding protein [Streptomyces sp. RFCAC02]|uniref:ABC transporter substrate-binding protein n=1 Tax=Streptomyces sp. RFCAC02 TaxID=2499143 RepID=UPI001020401D|nr:ABC transporter substrate-binding protein [Streptomyces sp. RFCAC02]